MFLVFSQVSIIFESSERRFKKYQNRTNWQLFVRSGCQVFVIFWQERVTSCGFSGCELWVFTQKINPQLSF